MRNRGVEFLGNEFDKIGDTKYRYYMEGYRNKGGIERGVDDSNALNVQLVGLKGDKPFARGYGSDSLHLP